MSTIVNGKYIPNDMSKNAKGGTEMMSERLLRLVNPELLKDVQIHISRPCMNEKDDNCVQILWCHDLVHDPENRILANNGWEKFDVLVFVSYWQRDQYILAFQIPHDKCFVIHNAIEPQKYPDDKPTDHFRFVYHTTPHRGLELLVPIFDQISKHVPNVHLDVFSSFEIYGWKQRDDQYTDVFDAIIRHPKMTYHGTQSNDTVLQALAKSHFFVYPSIWQETSCIAAIEAMKYGNIVVHPDLAALVETGTFGPSVMYRWTSNNNVHAQTAYHTTINLLEIERHRPGFLNSYVAERRSQNSQTDISVFASKWNNLLEQVHGTHK